MIRISTSGFDYKDWYGRSFPALKSQHRVEYYVQHFNTLELNITYSQLLSPGVGGRSH